MDSKTRPIRDGLEASCRKILRAVQTLCEMTFKAFFTICVISRTGTDVTAASDFRSVALPLELCDRLLLTSVPASEFQARIDCKVFERCDKSAARVSFNGRESRRCNVTRMAQVSYQILW